MNTLCTAGFPNRQRGEGRPQLGSTTTSLAGGDVGSDDVDLDTDRDGDDTPRITQ